MPVIRRCHDDGVDGLVIQSPTEIVEWLRFVRKRFHCIGGAAGVWVVDGDQGVGGQKVEDRLEGWLQQRRQCLAAGRRVTTAIPPTATAARARVSSMRLGMRVTI